MIDTSTQKWFILNIKLYHGDFFFFFENNNKMTIL